LTQSEIDSSGALEASAARDGVDLRFLTLVDAAKSERLILYAGAGISLDANLPTGAGLSRAIHEHLATMGVMFAGSVDPDDLLSVADAAESQDGGLAALQAVAVAAFPFTTARPSLTHRALALLLLEGAIRLLTTNWDTCVERAAAPEHMSTVVTSAERMQYQDDSLMKLHGCASRRDTVLLTSQQLTGPPLWAQTEIAAGLSRAIVVFLGIGDVAPYVQVGLNKVVAELGPESKHVFVVAPKIDERWDESRWGALLPSLPEPNRWPSTAADFAKGLLGSWVNDAFRDISKLVSEAGVRGLEAAFQVLRDVLGAHDPEAVLSWLRRGGYRLRPGDGVAHDDRAGEVLMALALHTAMNPIQRLDSAGPSPTGAGPVDILFSPKLTSGTELANEAHQRAEIYRQKGFLGPGDRLTVVCAGHMGPLLGSSSAPLPANLVDEEDPNVVSGTAVVLVSAPDVTAFAA
jgi:hypothetical protein